MSRLQQLIRDPGKIERFARRTCRYVRHQALRPFGGNDYKRFMILARSRTGSNLLASFLNSHPNVYIVGEIFARLHGSDYRRALRKLFSKHPSYVKAVGFKIFYYHPIDDAQSGLWDDLTRASDLYVVHLKRRNVLRTLLSRKIVGKDDMWASRRERPDAADTRRVEFTADELRDGFLETENRQLEAEKRFRNHNVVEIHYEDLAADPSRQFERVTNWLGVPARVPKSSLRKQNPEKLSELIANYAELKSEFAGTAWGRYFED